jgi:adenylate cyclase
MTRIAMPAALSFLRRRPTQAEGPGERDNGSLAMPRRMRVGFRASITALFVAIVLTVGLTLVYLSFERANAIIRTAAGAFIDKVAENAAGRVDAQFKDALDDVDILSVLPSITNAKLDNPAIHWLMSSMLRKHSQLFNLYVGYDDGSFLEVDAIDRAGQRFRQKLKAPDRAVFRLLVIRASVDGTPRIATTSYLSADLVSLAETTAPAEYDPRTRPWYIDAYDPESNVLTEPYIFFASGQPGYTLRVPIKKTRHGVVAGDILLRGADDILRNQRLGRSGFAFLFDDAGRIVAHPRMSELIVRSPDGAGVALPQLATVYKNGLPAAVHAWRSGESSDQFFAGDDGRTYLASFRPIGIASSAGLKLIAVAPLDEFFATVLADRRFLFFLTLACVLAALPAVFLLGSILSRSIREIAAETDRIQHFQPGDTVMRHSIIKEIDDLGRSVFTMRRVVETFANYVPKHLVRQLVQTGDTLGLGGERREVTIMFTDVTDFTAITEHAGPEQVMTQTSAYFAELSNAIMATSGTVDKFIGDAVMAIWNAPVLDADHVTNGCEAILACQAATDRINARFESEGWPAYRTRFGLHTGHVVVGNIGSAERMNYTVLGAGVNLAARLEALNKIYGTAALVSEQIKLRANTQFQFRSVDRISPKGFAEKFPIFELRGRRQPGDEKEGSFIEAWEEIYTAFDLDSAERLLQRLGAFLQRYPGDPVAHYHFEKIRLRFDEPPFGITADEAYWVPQADVHRTGYQAADGVETQTLAIQGRDLI